MAYLSRMKVGGHVYIYEVSGFRDENGRPRNTKHPVGKLDPDTGETVYKPEYILKMAQAGTPLPAKTVKALPEKFSVAEVRKSCVKDYGNTYFLEQIAKSIGLLDILAQTVPEHWNPIFTLASYLVCSEDPFMYCSHWIESCQTRAVGDMSSQSISCLLHQISAQDRTGFFTHWGRFRLEKEYLALDITSISSWSRLIEDVEWGYNRDGEDLPQINLCLLMGEKSRLPVFQTVYSGSLKDVRTLETTIQEATSYTEGKNLLLVMDKGFYSQKNVTMLLENHPEYRFILPVPFTTLFAKACVKEEKDDIDKILNTLVTGKNAVRGISRKTQWKNGKWLTVHIYSNTVKAAARKDELYAHISALIQEAKKDPQSKKLKDEFDRYLRITKTRAGYHIKIRYDVVQKELETAGWLVLISNHVRKAKTALELYRAKDVVEKGFFRLKNSIDLGRLRVHSQESMQNKVFVGFISLILLSHINKVMSEKNMYRDMSLKEMLLILKKLRLQTIAGKQILFPVSAQQRGIFKAFSVPEPSLS
jgi:transposase